MAISPINKFCGPAPENITPLGRVQKALLKFFDYLDGKSNDVALYETFITFLCQRKVDKRIVCKVGQLFDYIFRLNNSNSICEWWDLQNELELHEENLRFKEGDLLMTKKLLIKSIKICETEEDFVILLNNYPLTLGGLKEFDFQGQNFGDKQKYLKYLIS